MSNADWYPQKLTDRIPWHSNYNVQAQATGTTYGLSAADKTDITNDSVNVALVVNFKEAVAAYAQAVTEWAELILNGPIGTPFPVAPTPPTSPVFVVGSKAAIQARTRQTGGIVKADLDYTPLVGEAYGLVAPASGPPADPSIKSVTPVPGTSNMTVALKKGGYSVIAVDMRVNGGTWTQIGIAQTAEFIDTTPATTPGQPESREYRAQGMLNNVRAGGLSAVVTGVTSP